jgi:hypothetical protein
MRTMRTLSVTMVLLLVGFAACKSASQDQRAAALIREANNLLTEGSKSVSEWTSEYSRAFTPPNRAQFPANRDRLRASADKILKALDENAKLSNSAVAKYEQAIPLITNEQQRRGITLVLSALKKGTQVDELFKSQMQLVNDDKIADQKTFNDRFMQIIEQMSPLRSEIEAEFNEGKRLLGS